MGSPPGEEGRAEDEGPQQRISIKQSFAVGKFEVTFGEWRACIDAGGCGGYRPDDHGWGRGRQPVINVTWQDAQAYVSWLKGRTGKSYRLLSEAEWEYAARAGTTTPFSFGDTISSDQANYDGSYVYGGGAKGANRARTVPVDDPAFKPNQFGLFHMHGNVWEWVGDCWNDSYVEAPVDGSAWTAGDCSRRVLRGGSWLQNPSTLRSANRGKFPVAWIRLNYYGFRVARSL
jgi:formylglycine-generating enzyme required for sulfatase activity